MADTGAELLNIPSNRQKLLTGSRSASDSAGEIDAINKT
jgi:hypothetical protein